MKIILTLLIAIISVTVSFAQQESKSTSRDYIRPEFDRGATYDTKSKKVKKKKSKNGLNDSFDKKVEEYEKRMEENVKKNNKMAREMEKPQYSDPTYFGHKKKPKKRPPGKKKFCKECGMTH